MPRVRCTYCHDYFERSEMYRMGLSGVCSRACYEALIEKARNKQKRRAINRAKAKKQERYGARLSGTLRDRVRRRDGERCRFCGRNGDMLQIHHIEYRSQGGVDAAWNLILLCNEHHMLVHTSKTYWQPLLRGIIWMHYVEDQFLLVPELERRLKKQGYLWYEPSDLVAEPVQWALRRLETAQKNRESLDL